MTAFHNVAASAAPVRQTLRRALHGTALLWAEWLRRRQMHAAVRRLSPKFQKDIGLTAHDLGTTAMLDLRLDVERMLRDRAAVRSGNW